jgi:hypothetical protein
MIAKNRKRSSIASPHSPSGHAGAHFALVQPEMERERVHWRVFRHSVSATAIWYRVSFTMPGFDQHKPTPKEQILFLLILSGQGQLHAFEDRSGKERLRRRT